MIIGQVGKEGPQRDRPLEGLKVVVNAGNGMGGFLADTLTEVRKQLLVLKQARLLLRYRHGTVAEACYDRDT